MRAAFLDFATLGDGIDDQTLRDASDSYDRFATTKAGELIERCEPLDAVFTNKCRFDAAAFTALPNLKYIGLTATGSDGIDLHAARQAGVAVTNITAYCTQSVVQHVFATLLSLTHKLAQYTHSVDEGNWQRHDAFCMLDFSIRELSGLKMGIVGFGELGRAVAKVAEAFGMQVLIGARAGQTPANGRLALPELFKASDVISLHCPLNNETKNLINAESLALMKPTAVLINTARGGLVHADALIAALRAGQLAGAAIDVLDQEPPPDGHPLLDSSIPNLMVTPHIAWAAREARQRAIDQTAENFRLFRHGKQRNRLENG